MGPGRDKRSSLLLKLVNNKQIDLQDKSSSHCSKSLILVTLHQNKLECLSLTIFSQTSLILASNAGILRLELAILVVSRYFANLKKRPETNALAYFSRGNHSDEKFLFVSLSDTLFLRNLCKYSRKLPPPPPNGFTDFSFGPNVIKLFTDVIYDCL